MTTTADLTRDHKLAAIWRTTHRDFKGTLDGERSILVYRKGTCLVLLQDLTETEIADRLPKQKKA